MITSEETNHYHWPQPGSSFSIAPQLSLPLTPSKGPWKGPSGGSTPQPWTESSCVLSSCSLFVLSSLAESVHWLDRAPPDFQKAHLQARGQFCSAVGLLSPSFQCIETLGVFLTSVHLNLSCRVEFPRIEIVPPELLRNSSRNSVEIEAFLNKTSNRGDGSKPRICTILGAKDHSWNAKWPNAQSNCSQIQIIGLFWAWPYSTIICRREQYYQGSATHWKIAVVFEQSWTPTTANSVACTSPRRLGHPGRTSFFWVGVPKTLFNFFLFSFNSIPSSNLLLLSMWSHLRELKDIVCEHDEALFAKNLSFLAQCGCNRKHSLVISDNFFSFSRDLHASRNWPPPEISKLSTIWRWRGLGVVLSSPGMISW